MLDKDEPLQRSYLAKTLFIGALVVTPFILAGCTTTSTGSKSVKAAVPAKESGVAIRNGNKIYTYTTKDRECLERAMFFESARSSRDGLVAVGTVVMNRLISEKYPETICGVVGQKKQFAPGVMTRAMNSRAMPDVQEAADAVLKGERHPKLKNAMFFHTAGLKFPYKNMHYVLVAGGNAFYEKRRRDGSLQSPLPQTPYKLAAAFEPAKPDSGKAGRVHNAAPAMVASVTQIIQTETTPVQLAYQAPEAVPSDMPFETKPVAQTAFIAGAQEINTQKADAIGALLLAQGRPDPAS